MLLVLSLQQRNECVRNHLRARDHDDKCAGEREREGGRRDSFMSCNLCKHVSSGVLSAEVRARLIGSREESSECTVIGYRSDEERRIERVDWPCVSRGAVA